MLDLSTISFKVETSELDRAGKAIGELVTNVGKLDKAARDAAQTEVVLAKAAKLNADANLQNAKAQDVRLKSTIAADKADQQATAAIEKKTKATEKVNEVVNKNVGVLQLQKDILEFQTQGFSRGQSSILAYAKAAGLAAEDIGELGKVLETQRELMGDVKSLKEAANATNYLTQADQKMAAALNTSNAALDKAGTDLLVKYETALRKSGVSQDVATLKLAKYKAQLTQVAGLEEKRRAQHLARALQPQFTDIAVSLYSGQSPLTVLLQQSGQMVDLFKLSGIEADNLGKVMREAFASMIPAIATVAKGLTSLVFESFMSAGSAVTRFVGDVTGITAAMEIFKRFIVSGGEANFKYIASLDKIGKTFSAVAATGIAAMIAGMILLGLEYKKIIQAEAELTNALATSGGALGISKTEAIAAAEGMASLGVGTLKAVAAITEIAKAGNIGKESIDLITKSATDLEKTAGISIEETVKQFAKLQEEPSKALTEIAQKTGLVDKATLEYVYALEQQGDRTEAARVATLAFASANAQAAAETRDNWSPIEALWNDIKSAIGNVKQEIYDLTTSNAVVGALRTVWEAVAVTVSQVWFTIKGVGKEIGGIGAQIAAVMQGDFSGAAEIGRQMKLDAASAAEEQEKYVASLLDRTQQEGQFFNQSKEQNSQYAKWRKENDQALDKSISKTDKYKAKELEMQKAVLAGTVSQIEADKALAGWKKIIFGEEKTKKDPSENYFATLMREATASSIKAEDATKSLTASQVKLLETVNDPRFLKLSKVQQEAYLSTMAANAGKEQQIALTDAQADAEDRLLKLLGKSSGIGRQYYTDMANMEKDAALLGKSREEIEELTRAIFMATPAWKAYEKALEEVNSAARKFNEDSIASQAATLKENKSLDYRLSLLGKTAEEQRALSIEYNRANKISEVRIKLAKQLRDIEADIEKAKKAGLPEEKYKNLIDAQVQARKDAAEQEKVINREVAVQYAEDLQKEFDAIKNGISDSIVTALFEGGKSGSKKLRDLVVAQLRKPVTMVVNAVVNTLLGNVMGGLMGGSAAAAGGTGSLLSTAGGIGNLLGGLGSFGSTVAGGIGSVVGSVFGVGAGNVALGTSLGLGASSSTAAALAAAQAGGAAGGAGAAGMGSFLSGAGAAMPYIGAAIALISLISGMDDSGTYHTGGASRYSRSGGLTSGNSGAAFDIGFGQVETGKETISAMETLSKSLVEIFDGIAKTFGKTAGYEVAVAFADDTSKDGAWGAFGVRLQGVEILNWDDFRQSKWAPKEFGDGEEGYKQYLAAIAKDTRQVILDMDLPSWADQVLNEIGDAPSLESLSKAIQELAQMKSIYDLMTSQMVNFAGITDEAFGKLIKEFGDIGTMTNQVTGYYQNYYSEFERFNKAQADVSKSFTDLGLTMPTSREEFRKLAESQDLNTEAGRKMYAQLMALAASFGVVIDATEQLANARTDIVYRMMEQEAQLLAAQGRAVEADKKRRELLDKQRGAEYERLMKINPELARLTAELWALEDAAVAAANAAALEREISDNRRDYTDRILQQEADLLAAQGRTAEADKKRRELLDRQRARENERLMALNPELAKLAYELWLLEDATAAATRAAALEREISDNRRDYTDRILQQEAELLDAQGRTAEADKKRRELLDRQRARENERLMKINPELAKLAYELWLLEDATAAATRAAKERKEISDDLYNALVKAVDAEKTLLDEQKARLEETVSTLKAVFDILKSSVEDLYGEVSSTAAMQASEGRGVIAQAIATGILPDSKLLDTSIQAVRDEISNSLYVSKADADKARLIFAAQLALLKDTTEEQLTDAEKQLKAVNAQISYLDNILKTAKEQLDAFLGNTEVLKSVDKALADLYAFLQNPSAAKPVPKPVGTEKPGNNAGTGGGAVFGPGTGTSKPSTVNSDGNIVYADGSIGYRNSWIDNSGVKHYGFVSKDIWETERARGTPGYPAFANGGYYQGGMALVGEEGPELINFSNPGQVYTARQTASMLSGESSEVVAELKAVRSEIIMLRAEVRADVSHNAKTAKLLDRVIPEGDSVQVTIS